MSPSNINTPGRDLVGLLAVNNRPRYDNINNILLGPSMYYSLRYLFIFQRSVTRLSERFGTWRKNAIFTRHLFKFVCYACNEYDVNIDILSDDVQPRTWIVSFYTNRRTVRVGLCICKPVSALFIVPNSRTVTILWQTIIDNSGYRPWLR